MTDDEKKQHAELQKRWLEEMERLGLDAVYSRFVNRTPIVDRIPYPDTAFVETWLKKKQRTATRRRSARYWLGIVIAAIAAVSSSIAAWPIVKDWNWIKSVLQLISL